MAYDENPWTRLYYRDGTLEYMGFVNEVSDPHGAGRQYYRDGTVYKEGIWGAKGLLIGREYYPNGQVRFEGVYHHNSGYGPNWPEYGKAYDQNGQLIYDGIFKVNKSGLGWPTVIIPETYGKVLQDEDPRDPTPPLKRYRDPNMIRSFETFQQTVRDEYTRTYGKRFPSEEIEQILQEEEQEIRAEYEEYKEEPYLDDLDEEALFNHHVGVINFYLFMMH